MYALTAADERKLDGYEGVPHAYIKKTIPVNYLGLPDGTYLNYGDERLRIIEALVYVDRRVTIGDPKEEYIGRMNSGIRDALREGVPREYVDKYIRPFIPEEKEKELERVEVSRDPGEVGNVPT
jgi:gamma-glutamylcyclotransferase